MMNMMFGMMDICNELYKSERFRSLKKTMHDPKKGPIAPCSWKPYTADKPVHRKIIDCSSSITFVLGAFFTAYWHGLHNLTCSQYVAPGNNWGENGPKAPNYSTMEAFIFL